MKTTNIFYINPQNKLYGGNKIVFEHCNYLAKKFQKCFIVCNDTVPHWMRVDAYFINKDTAVRLAGPDDTVIFHWDHDANFVTKFPARKKYYLIQNFVHLDVEVFKLPIAFISVSSYIQQHTKQNYKVDSTLIVNGIDPTVFFERPVGREKKRIFAIDRGGWKGVQDVKAAEKIVRKQIPEAHFIYRDGLTPDEIAEEYSRAEIFISASWYEGFGLPVLEAMACGAAVITTDSKGVDDFAFDEINCLKVPPKNPEAIAEAIISLLNNEKKRQSFQKEGIHTAVKFNWDNSIVKLAELLNLKTKVSSLELFKSFSNVKLLTFVSKNDFRPYGEQNIRKKTRFADIKKFKGGSRAMKLLNYFGIKEEKESGDFDYHKVNFVDKEGDRSTINCEKGTNILYVPSQSLEA